MHLAGILRATARSQPHHIALRTADGSVTYAEFDSRVDQLAAELADRGVTAGERVVVLSGNEPEFVEVVLAGLRLGAIVVPVNSRSAALEIDYFIADSGARFLLVHPGNIAPVDIWRASSERTADATVLTLGPAPGYEDVIAAARQRPAAEVDVPVAEDDDALIIYTSGTTGRPKGALFDHHRVLWVAVMAIGVMGLQAKERMMVATPVYHSATLNLLIFPSLLLGGTLNIHRTFDPEAVLADIEQERLTFFFGVPTMLIAMLRSPSLGNRDLSTLRTCMYGAAPMPGSAAQALPGAFPDTRFVQLCGQTEAGPGGIVLTHDEILQQPSASGRSACPLFEVRVVDAAGEDVTAGQVGELLLKGETLMKGYWGKPEATAETIRDGWLHSGDLARVDEEGFITLVDRAKDLIITGGRNVYSAEVENALAGHPNVADLAIVGRPHPEFGETVVAVVTPVPGTEITLEELRALGADRIADFKLPRDLIIAPIPRNPSGKILKHRLRDQVAPTGTQE